MASSSGAAAAPSSTLPWSALAPDASAAPLRGGMGTVFKARWERRGLDVAVKLLRGSELTAGEFAAAAQALEREAETLRLASDSGANRFVVAQLGLARGAPTEAWTVRLGKELALFARRDDGASAEAEGLGGELLGLVMAWQSGGSLAARLYGGAVRWAAPTSERLLLLERIAEGVALLHSAQPQLVVHGDIKSDNVLLTTEGEPRLSDFGISEIKRAVSTSSGSVSATRATKRDQASGTWPYMAPELYKRRDVLALTPSPPTDVYAFATLAWEVLAGARPWAGASEADRLADIRDGANLDFARLPGDAPAALAALLARGVALDRAARPTARELCEGLRAARELLEGGRFDVFLSHCWEGHEHAPVTMFVLHALRGEGRRVWVDKDQMSHAMGPSMLAGIAASSVFVALVSRKYAASTNCMLELRAARDSCKPFVSCLVEPDETWWPPASATNEAEHELAAAINTREFMFADLRKVCAADRSMTAVPLHPDLLELLGKQAAVPMLLKLVADRLRGSEAPADAVFGAPATDTVGGDGAAVAPQRLPLPAVEARAKGKLLLEACEDKRADDALRLISEGADPDFIGDMGRTPLIAASIKGLKIVAARLMVAGAALDRVDFWGKSALIRASFNSNASIALLLIEKGARLDLVDQTGRSALLWACANKRVATALLLAARMDAAALNLVDAEGRSALDWASKCGPEKDAMSVVIRERGGLTAAEIKAQTLAKSKQLFKACGESHAMDALQLINEGADLDFKGDDGSTPLMVASYMGSNAVAILLMEAGAKLDHVNEAGLSALMNASLSGHAAIAQLLTDHGAKLDIVDRVGRSALMHALVGGHAAIAQLLAVRMDTALLNLIDEDGNTALDFASADLKNKDFVADFAPVAGSIRARGGQTGAVLKINGELLLLACRERRVEDALRHIGEGAALNFAGGCGETPLISASASGLDTVAARLVEAGAKLENVDNDGKSALVHAVRHHSAGHQAITLLLAAHMDADALNRYDNMGWTALDWALKFEEKGLVSATETIRARGGLTGADAATHLSPNEQLLWACTSGYSDGVEHVLRLINEGANPNFVGERGRMPLIEASRNGLEDVAVRLVEAGAELDLVDSRGFSSLMRASDSGCVAIAELLADKGAELDLVDEDNISALMHASEYGHVAVVQLLINKGAKLDQVSANGSSALHCASSNGHVAVAQLLADKGAKLDLIDKSGKSALTAASYNGFATVALLLAARMDAAALNLVDNKEKTALDYASEGGMRRDKVAEFVPAAAVISARGGLTAATLRAPHRPMGVKPAVGKPNYPWPVGVKPAVAKPNCPKPGSLQTAVAVAAEAPALGKPKHPRPGSLQTAVAVAAEAPAPPTAVTAAGGASAGGEPTAAELAAARK